MFIIYFLEFQILKSSSGKYLTGDNMTFADLGLLEVLLLLEEFFGMESFVMYPKLKVMSVFLNKLLSSFFDKHSNSWNILAKVKLVAIRTWWPLIVLKRPLWWPTHLWKPWMQSLLKTNLYNGIFLRWKYLPVSCNLF